MHDILASGVRVVDRSDRLHGGAVLAPFAYDEIMCRRMEDGDMPIAHLWRHPKALVIGLRDSRLPHAAAALESLALDGFSTGVRNSGGAAVPLDPGVLNLSLILPNPAGTLKHHEDFDQMVSLIGNVLQLLGVSMEHGEISGSYCPGEYDLSIGRRKFCGIAQRRQLHGTVIQAFIIVEGSGATHAAVARRFYNEAVRGKDGYDYPRVLDASMASLHELTGSVTMDRFIETFSAYARDRNLAYGAERFELYTPSDEEIGDMAALLKNRYAPKS